MENQTEALGKARVVERTQPPEFLRNESPELAKAVDKPTAVHNAIAEIDNTTIRLEWLLAKVLGEDVPRHEPAPLPPQTLANLVEHGYRQIMDKLHVQAQLIAEIEATLFG